MCIIVDACVADRFLRARQEGKVVYDWVSHKGRMVVSEGTLGEIPHFYDATRFDVLKRRNKIKYINNKSVNQTKRKLEAKNDRLSKRLSSNDHRLLALALVSGCKLLYTDDAKFAKDFKLAINPEGVFTPSTDPDFFDDKSCG